MRLEATAKEGEYNVWIIDGELSELPRAAPSYRDDLVIQLGATSGFGRSR